YPNPVSDELTVSPNQGITSVPAQSAGGNKTAGNKAYTVYLYNANGASVRQSVSQGDQTQLNVSGLPGGIYYLMIDTGDGSKPEVHKIIVKH
ncbi:MAG: T9SS type A sorting domain-containing protein, partial [Tannerellaceae bacterium]|nr:T9SS type A sorting domain-containing protein [Tannerellaceae bacterium]